MLKQTKQNNHVYLSEIANPAKFLGRCFADTIGELSIILPGSTRVLTSVTLQSGQGKMTLQEVKERWPTAWPLIHYNANKHLIVKSLPFAITQ